MQVDLCTDCASGFSQVGSVLRIFIHYWEYPHRMSSDPAIYLWETSLRLFTHSWGKLEFPTDASELDKMSLTFTSEPKGSWQENNTESITTSFFFLSCICWLVLWFIPISLLFPCTLLLFKKLHKKYFKSEVRKGKPVLLASMLRKLKHNF